MGGGHRLPPNYIGFDDEEHVIVRNRNSSSATSLEEKRADQ